MDPRTGYITFSESSLKYVSTKIFQFFQITTRTTRGSRL